MLRQVAALAGNRTKGTVPNFRVEALSDIPDREGKMDVPPDLAHRLFNLLQGNQSNSEAKLDDDPFPPLPDAPKLGDDKLAWDEGDSEDPVPPLRDLLVALGSDDSIECQFDGGTKLSYKNFSEAGLEMLSSLLNSGSFRLQIKSETKVMVVPDELAKLLSTGMTFTDGELQVMIREISKNPESTMKTLPFITARPGETGFFQQVNTAVGDDGETTWAGVRMATTSVPYGLGNQVEFAMQTRNPGDPDVSLRERVILPEGRKGMAVVPWTEGKKLVLVQGNRIIDATGRPITAGAE